MTTHRSVADIDFTAIVRPGDRVAWGQAGAEPVALTRALMAARHDIGGFDAFVGIGLSATASADHADVVSFQSYCGAGSNRQLARAGLLDVLPIHYSALEHSLQADVLLLQLAEDPVSGALSLGIAHEYLVPLLATARVVVGQINRQVPWTFGDAVVDRSRFAILVRYDEAPLELHAAGGGAVEQAIACHVAGLVEDRSTLQCGIGQLPETILRALSAHRDLGIHSGAIGDAVADLTEDGVITNAAKTVDPGVTVAGLMLGSRRVYDFAHGNVAVQFRSTRYTHAMSRLAQIERFVAINSAIEVDLTGQVNAEVASGVYVGAVGGAMDFLRGAAASKGGLPIVALPSTTARGAISRIVGTLSGPVSTPRADAGIIVTEHGVADLRGLSLHQRRDRMLAIAHPDHRATLAA